jgi:hypothetical protein
MAQHLCRSSLAATKQQSPLQLDKMTTTPSIFQLEMCATMFGGLIETPLSSLVSSRCQKVSDIVFFFSNQSPIAYGMSYLATNKHAATAEFHHFRCQLFHSLLSMILQSIKLGMTTPEIMHFGDGHFHRVVFGLGPYIADYKEQALLACIV